MSIIADPKGLLGAWCEMERGARPTPHSPFRVQKKDSFGMFSCRHHLAQTIIKLASPETELIVTFSPDGRWKQTDD